MSMVISADSRGSTVHYLVSEMRLPRHGVWWQSMVRACGWKAGFASHRSALSGNFALATGQYPLNAKKAGDQGHVYLHYWELLHSTEDGRKPSIHQLAETLTVRYNGYLELLLLIIKSLWSFFFLLLLKCLILLYPPSVCVHALHISQNKCSFTSILNRQPC